MNANAIEILDDLTLIADGHIVGRLEPSQAFEMAERLVRLGMRRVMFEEGEAAIVPNNDHHSTFKGTCVDA